MMHKQSESNQSAGLTGLVISYFGNSVAVEMADGQVFQCHLRRNQPLPVVGDCVRWELEQDNQTGIILGIEPRRSVLARGTAQDEKKLIAANVDCMVVVMAPPPVFSAQLVDRYLVAAEILGIEPVLVLNKVDLLNDADIELVQSQLLRYKQVPYSVLMTSTLTGAGLEGLAELLANKVSVLVGPSGVGKSSIISALTAESIRVGEVSPKGAGKHTTTATRFYHLKNGGGLIDSPGVRDFSLWQIDHEEALRAFKEFTPFLTGCKFRDCRHLVEPGCLVREAVAAGKIGAERFESYQLLMKEAVAKKDKK